MIALVTVRSRLRTSFAVPCASRVFRGLLDRRVEIPSAIHCVVAERTRSQVRSVGFESLEAGFTLNEGREVERVLRE